MIVKEQLAYAVENLHATKWRDVNLNHSLRDTLGEIRNLDSQTLIAEYERALCAELHLDWPLGLTYEETASQLFELSEELYSTGDKDGSFPTAHLAGSLSALYMQLAETWWKLAD